ncbi:hypothetical protein NQ999_11155 [Acinetobacter baumannii]|uniref:hypothetical protein n=1 Tax=Acinetobacter baumannii TaxID=470 RepID=UPI0023425AAA|nr:hypothetical protein [Acinetobacter baumannii]MDC4893620.1 hypothetical protein [Acinetobacter baumannii]MDC4897689.1 hypothetical protein [Acinetobacter baumannii]MDC4901502.1 hypothetical protein [Acinetobacter baumannii]MDC4907579.1 hypothetical protein [Acinetobacter baumannii]MDC4912738.1 hypothetical protein [Acinetobacter baumannii]
MICLIVPHDQEAVKKHDYGEDDPNTMTIVPLEEDKINTLWDIGYFDDLNSKLGLMISTGEDEKIAGQEVMKDALRITNIYILKYPRNEYLLTLKSLLEMAIEKQTELNIYL